MLCQLNGQLRVYGDADEDKDILLCGVQELITGLLFIRGIDQMRLTTDTLKLIEKKICYDPREMMSRDKMRRAWFIR